MNSNDQEGPLLGPATSAGTRTREARGRRPSVRPRTLLAALLATCTALLVFSQLPLPAALNRQAQAHAKTSQPAKAAQPPAETNDLRPQYKLFESNHTRPLGSNGLPPRVKSRLRAAWLMLVDPRDDPAITMLRTMDSVEQRYGVYGHMWVFAIEKWPPAWAVARAESMAKGRVRWAMLNETVGWGVPNWLSMEQVEHWAAVFPNAYGEPGKSSSLRLNYKIFCRWFSGFAYSHPQLADMDFIWRVDNDVLYQCSGYDPVQFMADHDLSYGFHAARQDAEWTMPTLGKAVDRLISKHGRDIPRHNEQFIRDQHGKYNRMTFLNNFEIVRKSWFESPEYRRIFSYFDQEENGFFRERWGDAPIRTIIAALTLRPTQVGCFGRTIGYKHGRHKSNWICPAKNSPFRKFCTDCSPKLSDHTYFALDWYADERVIEPTIPWT